MTDGVDLKNLNLHTLLGNMNFIESIFIILVNEKKMEGEMKS